MLDKYKKLNDPDAEKPLLAEVLEAFGFQCSGCPYNSGGYMTVFSVLGPEGTRKQNQPYADFLRRAEKSAYKKDGKYYILCKTCTFLKSEIAMLDEALEALKPVGPQRFGFVTVVVSTVHDLVNAPIEVVRSRWSGVDAALEEGLKVYVWDAFGALGVYEWRGDGTKLGSDFDDFVDKYGASGLLMNSMGAVYDPHKDHRRGIKK